MARDKTPGWQRNGQVDHKTATIQNLQPKSELRGQLAAAQRATRENSRRTGPEPAPEPAPEPRPGRKLAVLAVLNRSSCGWAHAHRVAQESCGARWHQRRRQGWQWLCVPATLPPGEGLTGQCQELVWPQQLTGPRMATRTGRVSGGVGPAESRPRRVDGAHVNTWPNFAVPRGCMQKDSKD